MSVFNDKNLNDFLFKFSQQESLQTPTINTEQLKSTVSKALSNLKQSFSPITMEGNDQIFQKDIFNLQALILWLIKNKVKFDNHRIAYETKIPSNTPDAIDESDKSIRYVGNFPNPKVWKEGLIEFLKNIRKQSSSSGNLYFQELISQIIEDANTNPSYDAALQTNEPEKEQEKHDPNDFSDVEKDENDIVDRISTRINPKYDIAEDLQITVKDLSDTNFPLLINKLYYSQDGSNKYTQIKFEDDNNELICRALNYLYARAVEKYSQNKRIRKYQYYVIQVYKFMGKKHCSISVNKVDTEHTQSSNQNTSYQAQESIVSSLQQGGSSNLVLPFELTTNTISLNKFSLFMTQLVGLVGNPVFRQEMSEYIGVLSNYIANINQNIELYRKEAIGTSIQEGGFTLSSSDNADNFADQTNKDPVKARNILSVLTPLILNLTNAVNTLRASSTISQLVGADILREQVQKGRDYVNIINSFITYINTVYKK